MAVAAGSQESTRVLIVGAGPVGLCMAIGLRRLGIDPVVVERHPSTLDFPKGRLVSVRTMEILREWGIDRDLEAAALPREESLFIFSGASLLADTFERTGQGAQALAASPTQRLLCDQMVMEEVLLDHVRALDVDLRFSTNLLSFTQGPGSVIAELTDDSGRFSLEAEWMVAADGARSDTRTALGFERSGSGRHGSAVSIYFRSPLGERMSGRTAGRYDLASIPGSSVLVVDNDRRWLIIRPYDPEVESPDRFTHDWAHDLARRAIGDPGIPVEIVGIKFWETSTLVADSYRDRRVLLAGDAAHVVTPIGGLGMNCGIADVHNLSWKLAGVIEGWANPNLIDTYETERRPVAIATAEASKGPARPPATAHGIVLGYSYNSAGIVPDGTPERIFADPVNDYVASARPGNRAPHYWLDEAQTSSTVDLFGKRFTVLTDKLGEPLVTAAIAQPRLGQVPVRVVALDDQSWNDQYGVKAGGAVVVRPDGHVSSRHFDRRSTEADLIESLRQATGHPPVP